MVKDTPVLSITHRVRTDISRVLNSSAPRAMPRNVTGEKKKKREERKKIFFTLTPRARPLSALYPNPTRRTDTIRRRRG